MYNVGSDWYFENIPDAAGDSVDAFVAQDRRTGTKSLLTMPLIGWTPKHRLSGHSYDCGFKVSKYDGQGSTFGGTSVRAVSTDQKRLAIYAAQRNADNALTLLVINKTDQSLTSTLTISGFQTMATIQTYRYSAANLAAIVRSPDQTLALAAFTHTFPADSITLFVLFPGAPITGNNRASTHILVCRL